MIYVKVLLKPGIKQAINKSEFPLPILFKDYLFLSPLVDYELLEGEAIYYRCIPLASGT